MHQTHQKLAYIITENTVITKGGYYIILINGPVSLSLAIWYGMRCVWPLWPGEITEARILRIAQEAPWLDLQELLRDQSIPWGGSNVLLMILPALLSNLYPSTLSTGVFLRECRISKTIDIPGQNVCSIYCVSRALSFWPASVFSLQHWLWLFFLLARKAVSSGSGSIVLSLP